jgi:hypothetical protein
VSGETFDIGQLIGATPEERDRIIAANPHLQTSWATSGGRNAIERIRTQGRPPAGEAWVDPDAGVDRIGDFFHEFFRPGSRTQNAPKTPAGALPWWAVPAGLGLLALLILKR